MALRQCEYAAVCGAVDVLAGHLVHGAHLVRAVLAESMESTLRGLGYDVGAVGEDDAPADGDTGNINLDARVSAFDRLSRKLMSAPIQVLG